MDNRNGSFTQTRSRSYAGVVLTRQHYSSSVARFVCTNLHQQAPHSFAGDPPAKVWSAPEEPIPGTYLALQFYRGMYISLEKSVYAVVRNYTSMLFLVFLFSSVWMRNDLFILLDMLKGKNLLRGQLMQFVVYSTDPGYLRFIVKGDCSLPVEVELTVYVQYVDGNTGCSQKFMFLPWIHSYVFYVVPQLPTT